MTYWLREIAGWLLVVLGLWLFATVLDFCRNRWIFEAAILTVVGVFVFRGGIHLLKVAVAARVCMQAADKVAEQRPPVTPARTAPAPKTTLRPTTVREPVPRR